MLAPGLPQGHYMQPGMEAGLPQLPPPQAMAFNPAAVPFRVGGYPVEQQYMGAAQPGMQYGALPMYPGPGVPPPGMPPAYQVRASVPCPSWNAGSVPKESWSPACLAEVIAVCGRRRTHEN